MIGWDYADTTWRDDPQSARDLAYDRGYDPSSSIADRHSGPPLDDEWSEAFDASLRIARHLRDDDCHVLNCGIARCQTCDERLMCTGPEPAALACSVHADECADCNADNPCRQCADERRRAA